MNRSLLYVLLLALIVCIVGDDVAPVSSSLWTKGSPHRKNCHHSCPAGYIWKKGRCVKTQPPAQTCQGSYSCQNGFCLPNRCFPCPTGAQCFAGPDCPKAFTCTNGQCIQNCHRPVCSPGFACPQYISCDIVGPEAKRCTN